MPGKRLPERLNGVPSQRVTDLLLAWGRGDRSALATLVPLVDAELRRIAKAYIAREARGHTLQTTALLNEAYVRLIEARRVRWKNRQHFYALAARLMRHVLVDHARAKGNVKRGGALRRVPLNDTTVRSPTPSRVLEALDAALAELAAIDPRQGRIVESRIFGGLSVEETARLLHVSPQTVMRDWKQAKRWLRRALQRSDSHAN
jgi:RNA polymerase sigma factor (TIGR02999 family)